MNPEVDPPLDEEFTSRLLACDEALAAGSAPDGLAPGAASPSLRARLERGLACVQLLQQLRPRHAAADTDIRGAHGSTSSDDIVPDAIACPTQIGRFTIDRPIGRGGFGIVYLAYDPVLCRDVALKIPRAELLADAGCQARFQREARVAAGLDHPNLVAVHEAGALGPVAYIAYAYCPGSDLAAWLKKRTTPVPCVQVARLVRILAQATHYAHTRGILHRDLKPSNVLLSPVDAQTPVDFSSDASGSAWMPDPGAVFIPRITDFGLAKFAVGDQGQTQSGAAVGTPAYMAPEQIEARLGEVSPATDVYALGAILYEVATGRPPFWAETAMETLLQVRTLEPVPPSRLRPELPRDLQTICLKCLEKDPARRYATAEALAEDLRRFLTSTPILARPASRTEQVLKWARRRPAVAALLFSLTLVTLLGLAGVTWQWRRAEYQRGEAIQAQELEATARKHAEARLYASQIGQAYAAFAANRSQHAERLLDACRAQSPEHCHWEWDYLKRQCQTSVLTLTGHALPITRLAYSPCGRWLASGSGHWNGREPGEVKLWESDTGKLAHALRGPTGAVYQIAFHPGGKWLAAACVDGNVWLWDLNDPTAALPPLPCGSGVTCLSFHPDGHLLAAGDFRGAVTVWDLQALTARPRWLDHADHVWDVAFSPDRRFLASASRDGTVLLRAPDTGRILHRLHHTLDTRRVAFSPDGRLLATYAYTGTVKVWDLKGEPVPLATHYPGVGMVGQLVFSPDGRRLACATRNGGVRIWSTAGQVEQEVVGADAGPAQSVAFSPDARLLAIAEDRIIRILDFRTASDPRPLFATRQHIPALAVHPKGRTVALAHGLGGKPTLRLLDSSSGKSLAELAGHAAPLTSVAWRGDGAQLVTGARDNLAILWSFAARSAEARLEGHTAPVLGVAYAPGGATVATASADSTVRLWDVATRKCLGQLDHPAAVQGVAFSHDGKYLASAGADQLVRIWDPAARRELRTLHGSPSAVSAVAFQPATYLLACAYEDHAVSFWNAATGEGLTQHATALGPGHATEEGEAAAADKRSTSLAFSADGRRLLVVSTDEPLQIWDGASRQLLVSLPETPVAYLCGAFDGQRLLAVDRNQLKVWDATPQDARARAAASGQTPLAWHRQRAQTAQQERNWFAVDFHCTRVLAEDATQAAWYARRGLARASLGQAELALDDHCTAVTVAADNASVWTTRAQACVALQQWQAADEAFAAALELAPRSVATWYQRAIARLGAGDTAGYRALCREMVQRFGENPSVSDAANLVYAVVPLPQEIAAETLLRVGERAGSQRARGAALYRAGRYQEALRDLSAPPPRSYPMRAWDMLFCAMAHHQLQERAEAQAWLTRACQWMDEADRVEAAPTEAGNFRWLHWQEIIEVQALRREAERSLSAGQP